MLKIYLGEMKGFIRQPILIIVMKILTMLLAKEMIDVDRR